MNSIQVGDEVGIFYCDDLTIPVAPTELFKPYELGVVTNIFIDRYLGATFLDIMTVTGRFEQVDDSYVSKTGRHFDEIKALLKKMRGDTE